MAPAFELDRGNLEVAFDDLLRAGFPIRYGLSFSAFPREGPEYRLPVFVNGEADVRLSRPTFDSRRALGGAKRLELDLKSDFGMRVDAHGKAGIGDDERQISLLRFQVSAMAKASIEIKGDVVALARRRSSHSLSTSVHVGASGIATYGPSFLPVPVGLMYGRVGATVHDGERWTFTDIKLDTLTLGLGAYRFGRTWRAGAGVGAAIRRPAGRGSYELGLGAFVPSDALGGLVHGDIPIATFGYLRLRF